MSSYNDVSPEPKKLFLAQILADDQEAGHFFIRGDYETCIMLMHWIVTRIYYLGIPKTKMEPLYEKLTTWVTVSSHSKEEVLQARRELSEILSQDFYSEMHFGLIQTSSLEQTKQKPKNEPICQELSSKL